MSKELAPIPADQIHAAQLAASTVTGQAIGWMNAAELSGSIKTAGFFATVADRLLVDAYVKAKESKSYAGMPYRTADGSIATVASLDEYCQAFLGKSYRRCEELLSNRRLVGEDLYEQAEALGFRQRDYNALKALPAEDREIINQALEAGADREFVIEQLVTLTERQIAQKAKLAEELTEAREDLAAKDQRAGTREKEIERLGKELRKAKRQQETATPDETAAELRRHAGAIVHEVRSAIIADGEDVSSLRTRVRELVEHGEANGVLHTAFLSGLFLEIERDLRALRDEYSIPAELALDDEPVWLKEAKADGVI
jgi:hypothetical protein